VKAGDEDEVRSDYGYHLMKKGIWHAYESRKPPADMDDLTHRLSGDRTSPEPSEDVFHRYQQRVQRAEWTRDEATVLRLWTTLAKDRFSKDKYCDFFAVEWQEC